MNKIIPYSQMKIIENNIPPYSILNPLTNSDSPSGRSKGDRLVSDKMSSTHPVNKIKLIVMNHELFCMN